MGCRVGTSWARALGLAALIGIAASADASCGNGESASLSSGTWSRYCCSASEVTNVDFYVSGGSGSDDNIEFRIGSYSSYSSAYSDSKCDIEYSYWSGQSCAGPGCVSSDEYRCSYDSRIQSNRVCLWYRGNNSIDDCYASYVKFEVSGAPSPSPPPPPPPSPPPYSSPACVGGKSAGLYKGSIWLPYACSTGEVTAADYYVHGGFAGSDDNIEFMVAPKNENFDQAYTSSKCEVDYSSSYGQSCSGPACGVWMRGYGYVCRGYSTFQAKKVCLWYRCNNSIENCYASCVRFDVSGAPSPSPPPPLPPSSPSPSPSSGCGYGPNVSNYDQAPYCFRMQKKWSRDCTKNGRSVSCYAEVELLWGNYEQTTLDMQLNMEGMKDDETLFVTAEAHGFILMSTTVSQKDSKRCVPVPGLSISFVVASFGADVCLDFANLIVNESGFSGSIWVTFQISATALLYRVQEFEMTSIQLVDGFYMEYKNEEPLYYGCAAAALLVLIIGAWLYRRRSASRSSDPANKRTRTSHASIEMSAVMAPEKQGGTERRGSMTLNPMHIVSAADSEKVVV